MAAGMILTGVRGSLECAHHPVNPEIFGGELHGHSYEIWAFFENPNGSADVRIFKAALKEILKQWDHKLLPPELATGEALAKAIGRLAKCVRVEIWRKTVGYCAIWIQE